jgi:NADH:ubiquinone reductase (H+-translocating)
VTGVRDRPKALSADRRKTRQARVAVIGSGFGGFFAARRLQRGAVDLTVLSPDDGMLYQPLLPDVAAGTVNPRSIMVPLTSTLPGARILRGRATAIDLENRTITYAWADGSGADTDRTSGRLDYDWLLLAPGSVTRLFDIPGLAEHATGLKTISEAMYLRDHLLSCLESARTATNTAQRRTALTFVVVGAGYAGVELTAQMSRLTANLLPLYRTVREDDVRWLLVDVASSVMPELGSQLGRSALRLLEARHVEVRLGTSVTEVTDTGVTLTDGANLDCGTVIWCAGVTPHPLIDTLGLPTTRGRLVVDAFIRTTEHHEVYAIGDAAAVPDVTSLADRNGHHALCPPTAQHAMRQATAAARNILSDIGGGRGRPYRHRDLGLVIDLGGPDAVAAPLGIHLRGRAAKAVACGYHLYALPTTRRRIRVAADWALAGRRPDDVSLGLAADPAAHAARAESDQG